MCRALGVVPIAAWLVKEHYGDANSWQNLDVGLSFSDPAASSVLIGVCPIDRFAMLTVILNAHSRCPRERGGLVCEALGRNSRSRTRGSRRWHSSALVLPPFATITALPTNHQLHTRRNQGVSPFPSSFHHSTITLVLLCDQTATLVVGYGEE